jgi:DNA-binding Lrp family transcriptional regulator
MLSEIERQVLNLLLLDSDKSRKSISRMIISEKSGGKPISESYLSKIIEKFVADRTILKFTIDINYEKLGYNTHAISIIKTSNQAHISKIVEFISEIGQALEVYTILGESDIFVRWLSRNNNELLEAVQKVLDNDEIRDMKTITLAEGKKRVQGPPV